MGKKATRAVYRSHVDYSGLLEELQKKAVEQTPPEEAAGLETAKPETENREKQEMPGGLEMAAAPSPFRQRILSSEQVRFLYAKSCNCIHDKSCILARQIPDSELLYSMEYLPGMYQCPECAEKSYIRAGAKDMENYEAYRKLFERMQLSKRLLRHIYIQCGMKTKVSVNVLTVWSGEDTWKVTALDSKGTVQLLHNNYHVTKDGIRKFDAGFHIQSESTQQTNIEFAIKVMETYSFDAHQAARAAKLAGQGDAVVQKAGWGPEGQTTTGDAAAADTADEKKLPAMLPLTMPKDTGSMLFRLLAGFKALLKRYFNWQGRGSTQRYAVQVTDFHEVLESGFPSDGTICIYVWKNKGGEYCWRCGQYQARNGHFIVQYGDVKLITHEKKVVAWKKLAEDSPIGIRYVACKKTPA